MTRRLRGAALVLAAALATAVSATGCSGGTPGSPQRENPNVPDATLVQMISCFRAHGLPNFPDPVYDPNDGRWHLPNERPDITTDVRQACASVMPHPQAPSPAPSAILHDLIEYAKCLRAHGVPDWPDPTIDGVFVTTRDPKHDPALQAVGPDCDKYLAGTGGHIQIRNPNG